LLSASAPALACSAFSRTSKTVGHPCGCPWSGPGGATPRPAAFRRPRPCGRPPRVPARRL